MKFEDQIVSASIASSILSVSKTTLARWERAGRVQSVHGVGELYAMGQLLQFDQVREMRDSAWRVEAAVQPARRYTSVELFAGGGGLALGLERAGFENVMLNEVDRSACKTLRANRPRWNVVERAVEEVRFSPYKGVDIVSGGFPCQAFSYAGNRMGFEDVRGTLFFEFARAIKECRPRLFLGENVRGLLTHDGGRTLRTIQSVLTSLGYTLIPPRVMKALFYRVPQKRERLMIVGIRNDLVGRASFAWPSPYHKVFTLRDALQAGELYPTDVPPSIGEQYPARKREIMKLVPAGGYWRDLPDDLQREYMGKGYFSGGGKTTTARRLSWDNPSLTIICSPSQKKTERCHPDETRPLTVRENARIQTFPDEWEFRGSLSSQYRQIGNAVPVNLALAMGRSLIATLNCLFSG